MTTRPVTLEINTETGESVSRPMNDAEYAQWQSDQLPQPTVGIQYP